jgi:hypothetical protein
MRGWRLEEEAVTTGANGGVSVRGMALDVAVAWINDDRRQNV